jgi:hypothetical protein
MMRTILIPAALAALLALATTSPVRAYGAYHRGYTMYGAGGYHHYGTTTGYGRYGGSVSHTGSTTGSSSGYQHTGSTTATGRYGGSYSSSSSRAYSPTTYSGYSAVGASGGGYSRSVTRTGYGY